MCKIKFEVKDRVIKRIGDFVNTVGDNSDYEAEFLFDSEWDGHIKTARFIQSGKYVEQILENDKCLIPVEVLKHGYLKVGVFTSEMATTQCEVFVRPSIKETHGATIEPTPDVYSQIISMIENMEVSGVTDEQIEKAVTKYISEHPIETLTESDVRRIVAEYVAAHKEEFKGDKGEKGDQGVNGKDGITPNLTIGTVETLNAGSNATATITGDKENPVLNLGIPKGADGQGGGTVGEGDVTTKILIDTLFARNRKDDFVWRDMPCAQIALILDDCLANVISLCVTNAKAKDVPLNMSAMVSHFNELCTKGDTTKTVVEEIRRGVENGGEVLQHGNGTITVANIDNEDYLKKAFLTNKENFISYGFNPRCVILDGGQDEQGNSPIYNDARTDRWVRALFDFSDGYGIKEPYNHRRNAPTTLEQAKSYIDSAVANKSFCPIFAHKWYDFWDEMIDYAKSLGANFTTYSEVYDTYGTTKSLKAMETRIKALEQGSVGKVLTSISAEKSVTSYTVGDTLDTTDISVTANYSDGTVQDVSSLADIDVSTVNMLTEGQYEITISYSVMTTTITITVSEASEQKVIYTAEMLTGSCDGTADKKIGDSSVQFTSGKQYQYVCDYEITAVEDETTTVSIRDVNSSNLGAEISNATVGYTGQINRIVSNSVTRQRAPFLLKNNGKSYSVTLTNITVTEL